MKAILPLLFILASVFMTEASAQTLETFDPEVAALLRSAEKITQLSGQHANDSTCAVLRNVLLRTESNEARIDILYRLSKLKMFQSEYDSAFWYNEQVRGELDNLKSLNTQREFMYYFRLGELHKNFGNLDESLNSLDKGQEYTTSSPGKARLFILKGKVYQLLGDSDAAKDFYRQAFLVSRGLENSESPSFSAMFVGVIFKQEGKYDSALKWLDIAEAHQVSSGVEVHLNTRYAQVYIEVGKYGQAAERLNTVARRLTKLVNKKEILARFWSCAGKVLWTESNYILKETIGTVTPEEALEKALVYVDESGRLDLRIFVYASVAETYVEMGNEDRGNELMAIAEDLKNKEYNVAVANGYKEESKLVQQRVDKKINEQILANQKQKEILMIVGAVALVMIAIAVLLYYRHKRQRVLNSELSNENDEIVRANKILARTRKVATNGNSVEELWLSDAKSAILKNITDVSPARLADLLYVSKRTLNRQAKKVTDLTPEKLILITRLNQAEDLLTQHREKNISEVAYECGFSDAAHFSRAFKDHFGHTPSQFTEDLQKLNLYQ